VADVERYLKNSMGESSQGIAAVDAVLQYLERILTIVRLFCKSPAVAEDIFVHPFFERFIETLGVWMLKKSHRERDQEARCCGFKLMYECLGILEGIMESGDRNLNFTLRVGSQCHKKSRVSLPYVALQQMVFSGFLELLIEGMVSVPRRHKPHSHVIEQCLSSLKNVVGSSFGPSLSAFCVQKLLRNYGETFWDNPSVVVEGSGYESRWGFLCSDFYLAALSSKDLVLCDNMKVCIDALPIGS
jgi:hypothetical protein